VTGSFLDTTIVVHMAEGTGQEKASGEAFVRSNQPAGTPFYALRELLDGRVRLICEVHNMLRAAENPPEAIAALTRRSPAEGRKRMARVDVFRQAAQHVFAANPSGPRDDEKREMLQYLMLKANGLWLKSRKLRSVDVVQPLACFNNGKLTLGPSKELRGPNDSFTCVRTERCAAAAYMYDKKIELGKLIDALHQNKVDQRIANKNETNQRRKALKELSKQGPSEFSKQKCRALGDAYFASMCPIGSVVLTTNLDDHTPLCAALGKEAKKP